MDFKNPKINIIHLEEIPSTNTYAKDLAKEGMEEGTIVIADRQTQGRGRLGRSFYSPSGTGIYMSIILKPEDDIKNILLITTMAAVSVAKSIETVTGKSPLIKWVNDVYLDGKKVCGILTEGCFKKNSSSLEYAILGIGINIAKPDTPFPEDIKNIAGYILEKDDNNIKKKITDEVINNFFDLYQHISQKNHLEYYRKKNMLINKPVNIIQCDKIIDYGICEGIDDDLNLLVRKDDHIIKVSTGEVSVKERI